MAVVARSHSQQLLIRRLHSSIRNISLPRSNGETQGTCRRVPLKTSSTMYCSGKRHTGPKEHSGSKPSKQVTGVCLQQTILMILIILHLPDGRPIALADAMQVPCLSPSPSQSLPIPTLPDLSLPMPKGRANELADARWVPCPSLSLPVPTLFGPSLPVLRLSQTFMLLLVTNREAESLEKAKASERNLAEDQRYDSRPTPNLIQHHWTVYGSIK